LCFSEFDMKMPMGGPGPLESQNTIKPELAKIKSFFSDASNPRQTAQQSTMYDPIRDRNVPRPIAPLAPIAPVAPVAPVPPVAPVAPGSAFDTATDKKGYTYPICPKQEGVQQVGNSGSILYTLYSRTVSAETFRVYDPEGQIARG
jgi:hypothetical protein